MISHNWDLYILDPIFLLLGLVVLAWMFFQERLSIKWILFFIETILFWFVNGVMAKWNMQELGIYETGMNSSLIIVLIFFTTGLLFSIILKPLATYLTGKIHHRRYWMYGAIIATIIGLVLTFLNKDGNSIPLFIFTGIMLGIGMSSNSLYFLFMNEQFYYRVAPVLTATIVSVAIMFGTFAGTYSVDISDTVIKNNTDQGILLIIITFIALAISTGLIFFNKEDPEYVKGFELTIKNELPAYNKKTLIYLMVSTFGLSMFYAITQSSLITDFIWSKMLIDNNFDDSVIKPWLRTFNTFYSIPQIIFGYFIYKVFTKRLGFKTMLISVIAVSAISMVVFMFTANPYLYIFFNLILGLAASQIFYSYFSMAIMWNYRSTGVPVTGFVAASNTLGQFVINVIVVSIKYKEVGVYKNFGDFSNPDNLINYKEQIISFNQSLDDITTLLFAGIVVLLVLGVVWIFFTSKVQFADYLDIPSASANIKKIIRTDIKQRINTRTNSTLLEKGEYNERIK